MSSSDGYSSTGTHTIRLNPIRKPDTRSSPQIESEVEDGDRQVHDCVCLTTPAPHHLIACCRCGLWFHAACMGIPDTRIRMVRQFVCGTCQGENPARTTGSDSDQSSGEDVEYENDRAQTIVRNSKSDHTWPDPPSSSSERKTGTIKEDEDGHGSPSEGDDLPIKTTWIPLCRRLGCPNQARLGLSHLEPNGTIAAGSKYCSEECGIAFFVQKLSLLPEETAKSSDTSKDDGRHSNQDRADRRQRGDPLTAGHVRALVDYADGNPEQFKTVGHHPARMIGKERLTKNLTVQEQDRINSLATKRIAMTEQLSRLIERQEFITLCLNNVGVYNAHLCGTLVPSGEDDDKDRQDTAGQEIDGTRNAATQPSRARARRQQQQRTRTQAAQVKEVCGFDTRLTWSDEAWWKWWSNGGRPGLSPEHDKDTNMPDHDKEEDGNVAENGDPKLPPQICALRRCDTHRQWQDLHTQDVQLDIEDCKRTIARIHAGEQEVWECVGLRMRLGRPDDKTETRARSTDHSPRHADAPA